MLGEEQSGTPLAYDEFGVPLVESGRNQNNPFGFTGYQADEVSGLYYAQARYYEPSISVFNAEDPLRSGTHWYSYCISNPLKFTDPHGLERIVVSGGITSPGYYENGGRYEKFEYQFIETALNDINKQKLADVDIQTATWGKSTPESLTWVVVNYNYTDNDIKKFKEAATFNDVDLVVVKDKKEFTNYINTKSTAGGDKSTRVDDQITKMSVYSHGLTGYLGFAYDKGKKNDNINFYIDDISKLDPGAFNKTYTNFYSCNTGTDVNGISFAQAWSNITQETSRAVVDGQTNYENINIPPVWNPIGLLEKIMAKQGRKKEGFNFAGSVMFPTAAPGVMWNEFKPNCPAN